MIIRFALNRVELNRVELKKAFRLSDFTSGDTNGTLWRLMPDTARPPDLTIEEHLRAAQGVLLLIAELFELHSLTPDGAGPGFSAAASATVAALCRQHGEALDRLVSSLPAATTNASARKTRGARP